MMPLIDWLNRNDGAMMAVLTGVYVLATLGLVWFGSKQIRTLMELERRRARPFVMFWIRYDADIALFSARLKNVGVGAAYDVSVTTKPLLVKSFNKKPCVFTYPTTTFLPPGEELTDAIAGGVDFTKAGLPQRYEVETKYADIEGKTYSERHVIDLSATAERSFVRQEPLGKKLGELNDTLKEIRRELAQRNGDDTAQLIEESP